MHFWLVIIDFDTPVSLERLVRLQSALGEDQATIGNSESGISVIIRGDGPPDIPPLPKVGFEPPNILVARLGDDAFISGRESLVAWWQGRNAIDQDRPC